jgi:zinc protease
LINAGSKFDPVNKSGLAYLTSLLIDEGAGKYNSLELDDEIESLGSIFHVSTDNDNVHLSMLSLKENLSRSVELISLVYQSPNFLEDDFNREQKKLLSKIIQNQNEPSYLASTTFDKIIFENTAYQNSVLGLTDDVKSITNIDVKEYYKKHFQPNNSELIVVGNIELEELKDLLNQFFISSNGVKNVKFEAPVFKTHNSKLYFSHKDGAAQSEIRVGHISETRNESDYFPKLIANSILGGQFSSRLNLNLREDKGFTYGIHSAFGYHKNAGYFEISTSVGSKDTAQAIKEIRNEIDGLKTEIKDDEIEFTKSYLVKRFPAMFETYSQISHHLSTLLKYNLSENYFDTYINRIVDCKKQDIQTAANNKIKNNELVYVVVGDKNTVLPQLKELSDLEIVEVD